MGAFMKTVSKPPSGVLGKFCFTVLLNSERFKVVQIIYSLQRALGAE